MLLVNPILFEQILKQKNAYTQKLDKTQAWQMQKVKLMLKTMNSGKKI